MGKFFAPTSDEITEREIRHMNTARKLAGECVVLLENNGTLPLKTKGNIALYGIGARRTVKGGTGSGDVNTRSFVSIEEGLKSAGFNVLTSDWMDRYDDYRKKCYGDYLKWISDSVEGKPELEFGFKFGHPFVEPGPILIEDKDIKKEADTAIFVISRISGEGADRYNKKGDYLLYDEEVENLKILGKAYDKLIVILNIGGVIDMKALRDIPEIDSIVLMSQLGNLGGNVICDVLTGEVNPSGKLTDTWAVNYEDYPSSAGFSHNDGDVNDEYYTEGIYVGYRYFDTFGVKPFYPFGYGKSYTDFEISTQSVKQNQNKIELEVKVTNIGNKYSGKEVVQVYFSAPEGKIDKPAKQLCAYKKSRKLKPGESQQLSICFEIKDMASYSLEQASFILEKGAYTILVGNCSDSLEVAATLNLKEDKKTQILKNLFKDSDSLKEIKPNKPSVKYAAGDISLELDVSNIQEFKPEYQKERVPYHTDKDYTITMDDVLANKCSVEELVSQLSVEELANFCVGALRGFGAIVGDASSLIPGAAGETTNICMESRKIRATINADGPAGLRLQPHFKVTLDGKMVPGGMVFGEDVAPFDPAYDNVECTDYYQYCTAIPIGWALAQAWNDELVEEAGNAVGEEMVEFGVDLWLAPALNIHRNPLCGRNFEYYSEDPFISGKVATAITKGVQSHKGKGTTIKHFAANSQEDNRYFTNSHISERALREIYLRGFEIAVRESQPFSIMTSYNLINGIHAANNYDLIQAVARDEWGFEGTVMTDWFTSQSMPMLTGDNLVKYPISASTGCIYAGNDLQMPGCQKNVDDIVEAVNTGKEVDGYHISLGDLQYNAANVIRVISKIMGRA